METINIFFNSDNNYSQPLGVAIYSLLDNFYSEKYKIKIHVLDGGISNINKEKLKKIVQNFSADIVFKIVEDGFFGFPNPGRYTKVAYYRLKIPDIFNGEEEKVIYLDCDILVLGNMADLYENNISKYVIGAVNDLSQDSILDGKLSYLEDIHDYFNAGVLLINLKKWRENNVGEKIREFLKKYSKEIVYMDQDGLNYGCKDQWLKLGGFWNFQIDINQKKVIPDPSIIHYAALFKPWNRFYHNHYQKYYKKYLKKWPGYKISSAGFLVSLKQLIKYVPLTTRVIEYMKKSYES